MTHEPTVAARPRRRPVARLVRRTLGRLRGRPLARLAGVALLVAVTSVAAATPAAGGTFRVSQCAAVADGGLSPRSFQADLWSLTNAWPEAECGFGTHTIGLGTSNWRLLDRESAVIRFVLPGGMPQTSIRTTWLDWRFAQQAPSTNPAFLLTTASGARLLVAENGDGTPAGAPTRLAMPVGSRALELTIWCSPVNGPGYCNWPWRLLDIRGVTAELEESAAPAATAGGALAAPGPHAGVEPLELVATDGDSGVRRVEAFLGGIPIGSLEPAGGCRDDRLPPCPQALRGTIDVDTRRVPDGARRLRLVVADAAGNVATLDPGVVEVANPRDPVPPGGNGTGDGSAAPGDGAGAGAGSGAGNGAGQGVGGAGGADVPPARGFPPNPLAGRGHVPNGRRATASARLAAWLEPGRSRSGSPLRRRSVTVPYGVRVRIRGRLTDRRGRGIGRATLAAIRREPDRPWRAVTGVRTRADGRFTAFTRIGASQELRFVYYAYGDSPRGRLSPALRVHVIR
jgi:hypothetical protein